MNSTISTIDIDDICAALGTSRGELQFCSSNVSSLVRKKITRKNDGSPRELVAPNEQLKELQRGIKRALLDAYEYPEYVFGLGGNTLRDHAAVHGGDWQLVQVDLRDFFPSISHRHVYAMWSHEFNLSPTIARLLTKLTTHEAAMPQGFPTSSHIAAIIAAPLTVELKEFCDDNDVVFSQYVDDLNFSGKKIAHRDIFKLVVDSARKNGFAIKRKKTKAYNSVTGKVITGVSLHDNRLRAPRAIRKKAIEALKALTAAPLDESNQRRAFGYGGYLKHLNKADGNKYLEKVNRVIAAADTVPSRVDETRFSHQ